jgi:hypothetical protein
MRTQFFKLPDLEEDWEDLVKPRFSQILKKNTGEEKVFCDCLRIFLGKRISNKLLTPRTSGGL